MKILLAAIFLLCLALSAAAQCSNGDILTIDTSTKLQVCVARSALPVSTAQQTALDLKLAGTAAVLTSNATNATATLANLSGLSVTVTSSHKYYFVLTLMLANSVASEGVKLDLNGGAATMTAIRAAIEGQDTALTILSQVAALNTAVTAATFTGDGVIVVRGYINPSSTGTFIPRFAENTHVTGTLTVYTGSSLVLTDIP